MNNTLSIRLIKFSKDVINLSSDAGVTVENTIVRRQLIRAVTSIGANYFESQIASSKADFINKLHIASKELYETIYWLNIMHELQPANSQFNCSLLSILEESDQSRRILISCILTAKVRGKK